MHTWRLLLPSVLLVLGAGSADDAVASSPTRSGCGPAGPSPAGCSSVVAAAEGSAPASATGSASAGASAGASPAAASRGLRVVLQTSTPCTPAVEGQGALGQQGRSEQGVVAEVATLRTSGLKALQQLPILRLRHLGAAQQLRSSPQQRVSGHLAGQPTQAEAGTRDERRRNRWKIQHKRKGRAEVNHSRAGNSALLNS